MNEARALISFLLAFALVSCSTLGKPENQPLVKMSAQYATLRFIESAGDPEAQNARRARIKAVATEVQSAVKSDAQATIPALDALVRSKVPWQSLSASDQLLASNLIDVIENELQARVGTGTLSAEQVVVVSDMMGYVIEATQFGAPQ